MDEETYRRAKEILDQLREAIDEAASTIEFNRSLRAHVTRNTRSKILVANGE